MVMKDYGEGSHGAAGAQLCTITMHGNTIAPIADEKNAIRLGEDVLVIPATNGFLIRAKTYTDEMLRAAMRNPECEQVARTQHGNPESYHVFIARDPKTSEYLIFAMTPDRDKDSCGCGGSCTCSSDSSGGDCGCSR